ncbi:unnamed protein product [Closterium sp. NIES-64]|nr:unnamed protein product [Closterium sp. NIES-64]
MILGRIKACQMAARVEATLFKEKELGIMREISVVRSEIGQFHGVDLIPPVDTSTRELWYKKHLFFARNRPPSRANSQLPAPAMDEADVEDERGCSASGTSMPLGRAGRRSWPSKAEELAKKGSDADVAAVHFWRTLLMFRRIVAEDLAVKLVRTPWHPYIQYSKLCRIPLFQHWAKRVEKTDTDTIKSGKIQPSSSQREPGFVDRHTLLDGASQGAHGTRVRRMMKVIDAVRQLRRSDGEADTEATVDALNKIAAPGIGTFADALTVLNADAVATYAGQGKGVKGLGKTEFSKLRVACAFVARGLKPETWVADLFPDTWVEQMKKTLADLARENDAGQLPPTNKSTKRKKTA